MYSLLNILSSSTKLHMHEYVNIEANIGKNTFINKDGSYSTFFEVKGSATPMGSNEINNAIQSLESSLRGSMKKKGFRIQFVFEKNAEKSHIDIDPNITPIVKNLGRLGLGPIANIVKSRKDAIKDKVMFERCYMVITTLTGVLSNKDLKDKTETRDNGLKEHGVGIKPGQFSQSSLAVIKDILNKHNAFANQVLKTIREYLFVDVLDCHSAVKCIANQLSIINKIKIGVLLY
jgi:hypothetical protein